MAAENDFAVGTAFPIGQTKATGGKEAYLTEFSGLFAKSDPAKPVLPFMVAPTDRRVINGHNGFWTPRFHEFVVEFIRKHDRAAAAVR